MGTYNSKLFYGLNYPTGFANMYLFYLLKLVGASNKKHYFKITYGEENHDGSEYEHCRSTIRSPFINFGNCPERGLHFTDSQNIFKFLNYGIHIREVMVPILAWNLKLCQDGCRWRTNKLIMGDTYDLSKISTFKYLTSVGADIRINQDFPLRWAASKGYLPIVKYLVVFGANVRSDNDISLRLAAKNGHLDVVKFLIYKGADFKILNGEPIKMAQENGHMDIVEYFNSSKSP